MTKYSDKRIFWFRTIISPPSGVGDLASKTVSTDLTYNTEQNVFQNFMCNVFDRLICDVLVIRCYDMLRDCLFDC